MSARRLHQPPFLILAHTWMRSAPGLSILEKKQGATGITTVAPYVTGQWGRGNNRLPG